VGTVCAWIPYRLTGVLVRRVAKETDVVSTMKLLGGLMILGGWWLALIVLAALSGVPFAWLFALIGVPWSAFVALRFDERWQVAREYLRMSRMRRREHEAVDALRAHRRALADEIARALEAAI